MFSRRIVCAVLPVVFFVAACTSKAAEDKSREVKEEKESATEKKTKKPRSKCADRKPPPPKPETLPSVSRILPSWARSLRIISKATVYEEPDVNSEEMGQLKLVSRLPLLPYKPPGNGCSKFWLKLEDGAWLCGNSLNPDKRPPLMRIQPLMDAGEIMPDKYAMVKQGGAKAYAKRADVLADKPMETIPPGSILRWQNTISLGGEPVWWISKMQYVKADRLLRHYPSKFQGVNLRERGWDLPVCIVRAATKGGPVYDIPDEEKGKLVKRVPHHSAWQIHDQKRVGGTLYYKIDPGWIPGRRVISAWPTKPPPGLQECEKWMELVVDHQSIVAYEGTEPVYMTMVSTGKRKFPTKYGIFRVWWKKAQDDMTSGMRTDVQYRIDDVTWAMFFWQGQALHAAHWHSNFGNRLSHSCVNLSPIDAKWLYDWADPPVPPAWINRRANERYPGTIIRVRHNLTHEPPFLGYARNLAPPEAVKALDEARKERMRKQTLRILEQRQNDN